MSDFMYLLADALHGLLRRAKGEIPLACAEEPVTHHPEVIPEEGQCCVRLAEVEYLRLLPIHRQFHASLKYSFDLLQKTIHPRPCENHEVVRVAHDRHDLTLGLCSQRNNRLEPMQVDVRQKRGYDASLRRPLPLGAYPHSVRFLYAHFQPLSDETEHAAVRYAHPQRRHEVVMRYRVKVGREVCVIHENPALLDLTRNLLHGILRASIGAKTI